MSKRGLTLLLVLVFLCSSLSGCYYFSAKKEMEDATRVLAELKNAGGPQKAPYEYCSAEKFLEVSKMEFDENDYKEAKEFAARSKSAGTAGLSEVKKK